MKELAKKHGLNEAIEGELFYCDVAPLTSIFVERVGNNIYSCYRITWKENKPDDKLTKIKRDIKSERVYLKRDTALTCFKKAEYVITWYRDRKIKPYDGRSKTK